MTSEPCWFQSVICGEMTWSWLMRAATWRGPKITVCLGNWKATSCP